MFRKELSILGGIVIVIFLAVAGSSWYAARALQQTAAMVALDTLPGLVDAGAAISRMRENWLRIHLVLQTTDTSARAALINYVRINSTEGLWRDYGHSAYSEQAKQGFQALAAARSAFLGRRDEFLELAAAGRQDEAATILEKDLTPLYAQYDRKAQALFAYNARVGRERGATVLEYARFAPFAISALALFMFLLGTLFGWRFAWSGPDLLSGLQRRRPLRSTLKQARPGNGPLTPSLPPSVGERVAAGRVRGDREPTRE
jgi:hypothetical protein